MNTKDTRQATQLAQLLRETLVLCAPSDVERIDFEMSAERLAKRVRLSEGGPEPSEAAISRERIRELRALCARATPGPWTWRDDVMVGDATLPSPNDGGHWPDAYCEDGAEAVNGGFRRRIIETDSGYYPPRDADRAFIAAARTALPELLDAVDGLQDPLNRIKVKLEAALHARIWPDTLALVHDALELLRASRSPVSRPEPSEAAVHEFMRTYWSPADLEAMRAAQMLDFAGLGPMTRYEAVFRAVRVALIAAFRASSVSPETPLPGDRPCVYCGHPQFKHCQGEECTVEGCECTCGPIIGEPAASASLAPLQEAARGLSSALDVYFRALAARDDADERADDLLGYNDDAAQNEAERDVIVAERELSRAEAAVKHADDAVRAALSGVTQEKPQ